MAGHWNTSTTVKVVLDACEARGLKPGQILQAAGIDETVLQDPDGQVTLEQMRSFWREAVTQSGNPSIGLHAGQVTARGLYKTYEFLFGYSSTVGAGITRFAEYVPLINSWIRFQATSNEDYGRLTLSTIFGSLPRPPSEFVFSFLLRMSDIVWNLRWTPQIVYFEFEQPTESPGEHARVLGCEVVFGAPRTELVVDRATWDTPVPTGDEALVKVLEEHAQRLLSQYPSASPLIRSVRDVVGRSLSAPYAGLDSVAAQLNTTRRTLQRRLSEEGFAYGDLVEMVRLESAKIHLLEKDLSLGEVAYFVGFAEQSSFSRAFRRWTGMSPSEYRRTHLND